MVLAVIWGCSETAPELTEQPFEIPNPEFPEIPEVMIDEGDAEIRRKITGELYYQNVLFSGYLTASHSDGSLAMKEGYFEGIKNGLYQGYYPNDSIRFTRYHLNGQKVGTHEGWFENGQQKFLYYFDDGKAVGQHTKWYADGNTFSIQNYEDGFERGLQRVWRPDGKLRSNYVVKEDGRKYGLLGIKRCTKLDGEKEEFDPYTGE